MTKTEFLEKLLTAQSPSGYEGPATQVFEDYCVELGGTHLWTDSMGNSCFRIGSSDEYAKKVMISAHIDELGFQIQTVTDSGLLHFISLGGIDKKVLPGSRVLVKSKSGSLIPGVIGKKPIHVEKSSERDEVISISDLVIDIGVTTKSEALELVEPGCVATFADGPIMNFGDHRIASRGLDDKAGVYVIAEVLRALVGERDFLVQNMIAVYVVSTVQEESGLRGAEVAARRIEPDISIDFDVFFATDEGRGIKTEVYGEVELGKGPVIASGPACNPGLVDVMKKVAETKNIPAQLIAKYPWGTNTCVIQTASRDCRTALIGIPERNMHTQVEVCDMRDLENAVFLVVAVIIEVSL